MADLPQLGHDNAGPDATQFHQTVDSLRRRRSNAFMSMDSATPRMLSRYHGVEACDRRFAAGSASDVGKDPGAGFEVRVRIEVRDASSQVARTLDHKS